MKKYPERLARQADAGFTLVELMIVVAIIGILAAVALPSYLDYLRRGKLVDATNTLAAVRAKMEQYYQDNRTYDGKSSPCASIAKVGEFSFKCEYEESKYKVTASGTNSVASFAYTIDQNGTMATTSLPANWGSTTPADCWIIRPGGKC